MSQPNQAPSAEDFLGGGGARPAPFGKQQKGMSPVAGTVERGKIVEEPYTVQERVYAPNKPNHGDLKFYDDGNPMWQLVIKIQTDHRDPEDPTDEGVRAIFVKGQLKAALKDAIRSSGAKKLEVGGMLAVKFVEQIINKDGFKQNIFACQYVAPSPQDDFFGGTPAQSTPVDSAGNIGNIPAGTGGMLGALKQQAATNANQSRANAGFDDEPPF